MYDAIVTWKKSKSSKVKSAHYVLGEPTRKDARSMADELFLLDEGKTFVRNIVIIKSKSA